MHHHDLPHAHESSTHHDESSHNVFSFIEIDSEFTLQSKIDLTSNIVAIISANTIELTVIEPTAINLFIPENESPPPDSNHPFKALRAPPLNSFC
jgi:hypothetical protein